MTTPIREVYQCLTCGGVTVVTEDWPRAGIVICGRCLTRCEVRGMGLVFGRTTGRGMRPQESARDADQH